MICCQRLISARHGHGATRRRKSTRTTKVTPAVIVAEAEGVEEAPAAVEAVGSPAEVVDVEVKVGVARADVVKAGVAVDVGTEEDFSRTAIVVASCPSQLPA